MPRRILCGLKVVTTPKVLIAFLTFSDAPAMYGMETRDFKDLPVLFVLRSLEFLFTLLNDQRG